jgi:hypothetical protein
LHADRFRAVEDLALQVGDIDLVAVGDAQLADAGSGKVESCRTTEAARADDEEPGSTQLRLPLDANLVEEDVAAVAEELLVVYRTRRSC